MIESSCFLKSLSKWCKGVLDMSEKLIRVGTTYLPVTDVNRASDWYVTKLDAALSYRDDEKAIINFAGQSFFLVKAEKDQTANFRNCMGKDHFSVTFEVDGQEALHAARSELDGKGVKVGPIEDRGHPGENFIFYDIDGNIFDVWSELSPSYKQLHGMRRTRRVLDNEGMDFDHWLENYLEAWRKFSLDDLKRYIANDYQARESRDSEIVDFGYQQSLEGWEQAFTQLEGSAEWLLSVHDRITTGENEAIAIISATLEIEGKPLDTANLFFDVFKRSNKHGEWKMVRSYIEAGIPCDQLRFSGALNEMIALEQGRG